MRLNNLVAELIGPVNITVQLRATSITACAWSEQGAKNSATDGAV
jgi:hypothetical protein